MAFTVRKGIPVPPRTVPASRTGTSKYNLQDLQESGDSIFVPNAKKSHVVTMAKSAKRLGFSITTRRVMDFAEYDADGNGVGDKVEGVGVWRV
jgi:hypothetical protein